MPRNSPREIRGNSQLVVQAPAFRIGTNRISKDGESMKSMNPTADGKQTVSTDADRLRGVRILFADTDESQRKLFVRILERQGAQVSAVPDGAHALAMLFAENARDDDTDLVILNANSPATLDIQAIKRLRDGGFRKPILAMGWPNETQCKTTFLEAGYDDFVSKNLPQEDLIATLCSILNTSCRAMQDKPHD
jgi:two-component system, sensor histidine kinase and response regulator